MEFYAELAIFEPCNGGAHDRKLTVRFNMLTFHGKRKLLFDSKTIRTPWHLKY